MFPIVYAFYVWGGILSFKKRTEYLPLTDEELVKLSQSGDQGAFNILAARYLKPTFRKTNSAYIDSDDFMQEGMFGFLNAVRTYNESKGVPFKAYSSVCMRNSINTAAGNISDEIPVSNDSDTFTTITGAEDPLKQILVSEELDEVLAACDVSLSSLEKTVVFLRAGGMSYAEIGERLSMPAKAVDNAVQRARRKLKQVITAERS